MDNTRALCGFTDQKQDKSIVNLINPGVLEAQKDNLKDTLNEIYNFKQDTTAIKNIGNFEDYRRNYPIRYEWPHYNSLTKLPIVEK